MKTDSLPKADEMAVSPIPITVGVLALQGAFNEHIQLLRLAANLLSTNSSRSWTFLEVRTVHELNKCDALIIPGGESTAISLVAQRSGMLEPLRDFVKMARKPTWGTCAGLILLAESANRTKKGGQELIGGLDVRVNRNHFGRQIESFSADLDLPFLAGESQDSADFEIAQEKPFRAVFIRAPIVERLLPSVSGMQVEESMVEETVVAPSKSATDAKVEILAVLPGRVAQVKDEESKEKMDKTAGDIVAVRQGNVFGTSFHPELTGDPRIHVWWLKQVTNAVDTYHT